MADAKSSRGLKVVFTVIAVAILIGLTAFMIVGRSQGLANSDGFLGTRATLFADFNLVAQIILILGLTLGFGLARAGNIQAHQYNQTMWVFVNLVLVIFIMVVSYQQQVAPGIPEKLLRAYYASAFTHALLGTLIILSALLIVFRMNFPQVFMRTRMEMRDGKEEKVTVNYYPKSIWKNQMRITLAGYWLIGLLGIATYFFWYVSETTGGPEIEAEAGQVVVPIANFAFNPVDLEIPIGTTVVFINQDDAPHTVTFDNSEFAETYYELGDTFEITFTEEGAFPFFCAFHGSPGGLGMAGQIRVGGAAAIAAAPVPTAITPPESTPEPTVAPVNEEQFEALELSGFGEFVDVAARNDGFNVSITGLPAPEGDLHVWLDGDEDLDLGPAALDGNGNLEFSYASPDGANLLANYSGFFVAVSDQIPFRGEIPAGVLGPVRQLLLASDDAPGNRPYTVAVIRMTEENLRHAQQVVNAALAGDFNSLNRHAEHSFAIVEGIGGPNYRDFDNDGGIVDPGDGFGILNYADAIAAQAAAAIAAPDVTPTVTVNAQLLAEVASNLRGWGEQIVQLGIEAHQAADAATQIAKAEEMLLLAENLLNGTDANGNGIIEPIAGEGGVFQAYQQAQYMAAIGVEVTTDTTPSAEEETAPEPAATPEPTEETAAEPLPPVFVTYRDFEILPAALTVQVGQQMVFLIESAAGQLHQPYTPGFQNPGPNDFEAPGTLGDGTTYAFTFQEAGTVTLLCGFHANMVAQVEVVQP